MNTFLWVTQILISLFFIMPGLGKLTGSKEKHIADGHLQPNDNILPIRILGVFELLGCLGIIVPWFTGIVPILTPITAVCFCIIMAAGMLVHSRKHEYKMLPMLIVVFTL
ncbi:DoxX family protein [Mucilaginibacter limnophilus]|uniref:DoxX family protein n=1 Tax=Mucilaginibacter limnophilus TaxID=1932778 RepID=A0A437MHT9_9SPHI|nr:DoxX family protein [Mucilaginibacter limnophilus]RVT97209.1 DoxX family protein [Mucilaginibacter limnophilus]